MTFQKDPEQNETRFLSRLAELHGKRVLEIGCGEGRLTWRYAGKPSATFAIDPDRDALRVAAVDRPSGLKDKVHLASAMAEQLPFRKETFDIALLAWSF